MREVRYCEVAHFSCVPPGHAAMTGMFLREKSYSNAWEIIAARRKNVSFNCRQRRFFSEKLCRFREKAYFCSRIILQTNHN